MMEFAGNLNLAGNVEKDLKLKSSIVLVVFFHNENC